jgi:hypothetical protein
MDRAVRALAAFVLVLISAASAQCANLSDDSTWGTMVVNDTATGTLYVNENTILCTDTYYFNAAAATAVLRMNSSNIFLDCNNSILDGVDGNGYGVYITGKENDTVGNCTVMNYQYGFYAASDSNNSAFINNSITNNSVYGIYVLASSGISICYNTLYLQNGTNDAAVYGYNSDNITLYANMMYDNYLGAYIQNSTSIYIGNSSFLRHAKEAMRIINVSGGNISWNYANVTGEQAIQLGDSSLTSPGVRHILIADNRFYRVNEGVRLYHNSANITIVNNEIRDALSALAILNNLGDYIVNNTLVGLSYDFLVTNDNVDASYCNHLVENNTGTGGKAIFYSNETVVVSGEGYSNIEICGANNSVIRDVLINGNPTYRSNHVWIELSDNVTVINATLNNTSFGLSVFEHSTGFYGENITIYNAGGRGIAMSRVNNSLLRNLVIDGSGFMGGGEPYTEAGGGYIGIIMYSTSNVTVENAVIVNNSKYVYPKYKEISILKYSDTDLPSSNNTFRNITIYGSTQHFYHNETGLDNVLQNFSICRNSSAAGCVKWGSIDLDSTYAQINYSGLFTESDFVSLNSSEATLDLFNSSANITLDADCSPGVIYNIYRKEEFSSSAADIVANGTLYTPTRMSCADDYFTFGVTSFSGYALEEGTLNLTIYSSTDVLPHVPTNASCDSSNSEVMLELYRNDVLVANGTSHVEDASNLTAGTYNYVCNTTNY